MTSGSLLFLVGTVCSVLLMREDGHSKWDQSFKHSSFFSQLSEWNYKTLASMDSQVLSSDWKKENANTSSYKVRASVTVESWYFSTLKGPNLGGWGILFRCLLGISWLRCFKHVHKGMRACRRLRIFCRNDIFWQPWELLDVPLDEIEEVARERENWGILLRLLPSWPSLG